jgi:hypothetical protein
MPRTPRRLQWTEEACYHLMDRGHNREPIFADDEDRQAFLNWGEKRGRKGVRTLYS